MIIVYVFLLWIVATAAQYFFSFINESGQVRPMPWWFRWVVFGALCLTLLRTPG